MKILFITDNFPPETNAPAVRTFEHCKEWIKSDAAITVLTTAPNFPSGKIYPGFRNKLYNKRDIDGINVIRVWSYITANQGFIKRIADYISFAATAFLAGLFIKTDIIIATSPQFFVTISAFLLSIIKRKPWVFELRDLWPKSIEAVGAIRNKSILKFLESVELFLYRNSDSIVAVSEAFKDDLVSRGIIDKKILIVTNGSNLELFQPLEKDQGLIKSLRLENKFIVGYLGTIGLAHGFDFILESIASLEQNDIHFLVIGDGAEKKIIKEKAQKLNLQNITFLESIEKSLVPKYLSIFDIALVPLKKADIFKTVIPSKIFESFAMRKPILLGVEGQAKKIIKEYNAGLCFEPENRNDFIQKVLEFKSDLVNYKAFQAGCERLANDFDRKKLAKKMLEHIKTVASRNAH